MSPSARGALRASIVPALLTVVVYLVPVGGAEIVGNPNELVRILMTEALLVDGTLAVDGPITAYGASQDQSEREGHIYSDKAPGVSLLSLPVAWLVKPILPLEEGSPYPRYWPLRHVLVAFVAAIPTVLGVFALLMTSAPRIPAGARAWVAALLCVATPMLTYATTLFSHVPAALLCAAAWALAIRGAPTAGRAGLAGLLAGFAVSTEYPTILVGAVLMAAVAARRPMRLAPVALFALGMGAGLAPALLYHQEAFGSPFSTGYAFKVDPGHTRVIATGASGVAFPAWDRLWGVTGSARRGLFFYAPVLLAAIPGILSRFRQAPREAASVAGACGVYLLFGASFVDWEGGWCAAARHLVPIVPLLCVAVMWALESGSSSRLFVGAFAALAGVSAAHQALSVMLTPLYPEIFDAPLAQVTLRSLLEGAAMPNAISWLGGVPAMGVALAWGALVLAVVLIATGRLPARAPILAAAAFVAALGLQGVWSSRITAEQERGRAIVLDRLGHHELARAIVSRRP